MVGQMTKQVLWRIPAPNFSFCGTFVNARLLLRACDLNGQVSWKLGDKWLFSASPHAMLVGQRNLKWRLLLLLLASDDHFFSQLLKHLAPLDGSAWGGVNRKCF